MRISDWSSDVCSSDLITLPVAEDAPADDATDSCFCLAILYAREGRTPSEVGHSCSTSPFMGEAARLASLLASRSGGGGISARSGGAGRRAEEHTSELQSLMRNSYAVCCLKKQK